VDAGTLADETLYQIGALRALAAAEGARVSYVKPHGALYNRIVHDEVQAAAVIDGILAAGDDLAVMGLPGSRVLRLAADRGLRVLREAFADRAYRADGTLVPRSEPGAVLHEPEAIAARVVELATTATMTAITGESVAIQADSVRARRHAGCRRDRARRAHRPRPRRRRGRPSRRLLIRRCASSPPPITRCSSRSTISTTRSGGTSPGVTSPASSSWCRRRAPSWSGTTLRARRRRR
jgi:hypothetical protein